MTCYFWNRWWCFSYSVSTAIVPLGTNKVDPKKRVKQLLQNFSQLQHMDNFTGFWNVTLTWKWLEKSFFQKLNHFYNWEIGFRSWYLNYRFPWIEKCLSKHIWKVTRIERPPNMETFIQVLNVHYQPKRGQGILIHTSKKSYRIILLGVRLNTIN